MCYDQRYKQNKKQRLRLCYILAWELCVAQGTHSYARRLPALGRKLQC